MATKIDTTTCPKCGKPFPEGSITVCVDGENVWCEKCLSRHKPEVLDEIGNCLRSSDQLSQMLFPDKEAETEFDYN